MDDDEEIQSPPSVATGSPSSPSPPNGRITVTVAAVPVSLLPPPQNYNSNSLPLALPMNKSNGGGREDCWSEGATAVLIDAWGERYLELSRGNLKQKHWKEVADIVSSRDDYAKTAKTDIQCKNRIDTVKKKYKAEKAKMPTGGGPSKWLFYERLDQLIGSTGKIPAISPSLPNKVPLGIPVGIRGSGGASGSSHYQVRRLQQKRSNNQVTKNQNLKAQFRKRGRVETESSSEENEGYPDSDDSSPPEKRPRAVQREANMNANVKAGKERKGWGSSIRMLTQAMLKFGEAYEQAESAKLQQLVEMEKTRMKFAKELELQRMQFFMKTQMEISQLKNGRRGGNASNHHSGNNIHNNINSDSDN